MNIRCPTCGKLISLNFETVSVLGRMNKIDFDNEKVAIESVLYCPECGESHNMNLLYLIDLKDTYFTGKTDSVIENAKYEFGGKNE